MFDSASFFEKCEVRTSIFTLPPSDPPTTFCAEPRKRVLHGSHAVRLKKWCYWMKFKTNLSANFSNEHNLLKSGIQVDILLEAHLLARCPASVP